MSAMTPERVSLTTGRREKAGDALPYFVAACVFTAICVAWDVTIRRRGGVEYWHGQDFWDARAYAHAVDVFRAGRDPYADHSTLLRFIYPPVFLPAISWLRVLLPGAVGKFVFMGTLFATTLALPWLVASYMRDRWLTPAIALVIYSFEPKLFGEASFLSGNIANILWAAILTAGLAGVRRNRWWPFYLVLALAAITKPPLLALLILPAFAGRRQLWQSGLCAAVVAAANLLQRILLPERFHEFQGAVYDQVVLGTMNLGVYSYIVKLGGGLRILQGAGGWIAHFAVIAALVVALWLLRGRRSNPAVAHLWVPCLLVTAIVANPRVTAYDVAIGMIAATFLCVECILSVPEGPYRALIVAAPMAVFVAILASASGAAICTLLLGSVLLTIARLQCASPTPLSADTIPAPSTA